MHHSRIVLLLLCLLPACRSLQPYDMQSADREGDDRYCVLRAGGRDICGSIDSLRRDTLYVSRLVQVDEGGDTVAVAPEELLRRLGTVILDLDTLRGDSDLRTPMRIPAAEIARMQRVEVDVVLSAVYGLAGFALLVISLAMLALFEGGLFAGR